LTFFPVFSSSFFIFSPSIKLTDISTTSRGGGYFPIYRLLVPIVPYSQTDHLYLVFPTIESDHQYIVQQYYASYQYLIYM
jgi:hypothetical protein